jgi:RNA polymerase sigma factor (TIGR02999 family)
VTPGKKVRPAGFEPSMTNPRFRRSLEPSSANADIAVSVLVRRCHPDGPDRVSENSRVVPECTRVGPPRYKRDIFLLSILLSTPFEWHTITPFCMTEQQASKPMVYEELRKLAAAKLAHEKPGQTLEATALVHEAYIRLVDTEMAAHWNSRGHFFGAAAMRRILVERARQRESLKGGGGRHRVDLAQLPAVAEESCLDILAIHDALEQLEATDPRRAQIVKLRFFAGVDQRAGRRSSGGFCLNR